MRNGPIVLDGVTVEMIAMSKHESQLLVRVKDEDMDRVCARYGVKPIRTEPNPPVPDFDDGDGAPW